MLTLHAPILETRHLNWRNEADCSAFATALAHQPDLRHASLHLQGPLGAGKTSFVRHLLRALGVTGRIKSPTYAVLESHQAGNLTISHFDFYRFSDPREWLDAGFRELYAQPGLKLAEWPEKAEGFLPTPDLDMCIEPLEGDMRAVILQARSARGLALLP
jgi:tRNA threonylcarbamoyladenosine biosynthesis protein TsaE